MPVVVVVSTTKTKQLPPSLECQGGLLTRAQSLTSLPCLSPRLEVKPKSLAGEELDKRTLRSKTHEVSPIAFHKSGVDVKHFEVIYPLSNQFFATFKGDIILLP